MAKNVKDRHQTMAARSPAAPRRPWLGRKRVQGSPPPVPPRQEEKGVSIPSEAEREGDVSPPGPKSPPRPAKGTHEQGPWRPGLKLTRIEPGEFTMGTTDTRDRDGVEAVSQHRSRRVQGRTASPPRADHEAVLPGHPPGDSGPVPPICRGRRLPDRSRARRQGGLWLGRSQESIPSRSGLYLAEPWVPAD